MGEELTARAGATPREDGPYPPSIRSLAGRIRGRYDARRRATRAAGRVRIRSRYTPGARAPSVEGPRPRRRLAPSARAGARTTGGGAMVIAKTRTQRAGAA